MRNGIIIVALVVIALTGGLFISGELNHKTPNTEQEQYTGEAQIGGSFTLTDQDGKTRSDSEFRGKYMLVFFGFTNCPSICPPGMMNITQALESLGSSSKKITPIFITVDPERDTPARMKEFLSNFHPAFVGLTGDTKAVESAYKVYSSKVEAKDQPDGYMMDHSGFIYLMDTKGKYVAHFSYDTAPDEMARKIKEYL